jgi:hypothetical protein
MNLPEGRMRKFGDSEFSPKPTTYYDSVFSAENGELWNDIY